MPDARSLILFLELRLTFDREPRERDRFETCVRDRFARHFANSVSAELDPLQRLIDFVKGVLFLRKQTEREIAIVSVGASVGLMHAECGSFTAFSA